MAPLRRHSGGGVMMWLAAFLGAWLLACALSLATQAADGLYTEPFLVLEPGVHTAPIRRLDVDAQGRFLVTASDDKTVRVWSAKDGRLQRTIRFPAGPGDLGKAYAVAISPDGETVAAGGWTSGPEGQDSIYLFERASGRLLRRMGGLPNVVLHLAFSPDGQKLAATLSGKNGVHLFDVGSGTLLAPDGDYGDRSSWATWAPDGKALATTSYDGQIRLYDGGLKRLKQVRAPGGQHPFGLVFSPDGKRLAVGYADSTAVDVFDAATLMSLLQPDTKGVDSGNFYGVAWSTDDAFLLAGGTWQVGGYNPVRRWSESGRGAPRDLMLSRDTLMDLRPLAGGRVAFAAQDPALGLLGPMGEVLWRQDPAKADLRDQEQVFAVSADGAEVVFGYAQFGRDPARFALRQRQLMPGGGEGLVKARTSAPGLEVTGWKHGTDAALNGKKLALETYETSRSLAIAPDGQRFVLGAEWWLRLFDHTGEQLWERPVPGIAWAVNVSGDGRLVVAGYGDGTIRWHRLSDGEELLAFYPHGDKERWVAWTPQGYYTASPGGEDLIGWQVNRGWDEAPEFYTAARFRDRFHRPDVVALVLDELDVGKALARANREAGIQTAAVSIEAELPPRIEILDPVDGTPVTEPRQRIRYRLYPPSRGEVSRIKIRIGDRVRSQDIPFVVPRDGLEGRLDIDLWGEDVTLSLIAEGEGKASDPASVKLLWRGTSVVPRPPRPRLLVLAAGVSDYGKNNDHLKLNWADDDARDLATFLREHQGEVYEEIKLWYLTDEEVTQAAFFRDLAELVQEMREEDVAIIFFSGHGSFIDGGYYLLPHGVDVRNTLATQLSAIDYDRLKRVLVRIADTGKTFLFLDACRTGSPIKGAKASGTVIDRIAADLAATENGVVVVASAKDGEISVENERWQNGAFTEALLEGLAGEADRRGDGDGAVSVSELIRYVKDQVPVMTGKTQHPQVWVPFEKLVEARIAAVAR